MIWLWQNLYTESKNVAVEDVDRRATYKKLDKPQVFSLYSNNEFVYKGSYYTERKY